VSKRRPNSRGVTGCTVILAIACSPDAGSQASSAAAGSGSGSGGSVPASAGGSNGGSSGAGTGGASTGTSGAATSGAVMTGAGGATTNAMGAGGVTSSGGSSGSSSAGGSSTGGDGMPGAGDCGSRKWACWPMPNPSASGLPNPASYADLGETVLDQVTGLEWQKDPPDQTFVWDAGLSYCEELSVGDNDDFRLPTRIELMSIMDFTNSGAKFAPSAFAGADGGFYKTASDWILTIEQRGAGAGRDYAWAFNMSDGILSNAYSKATAARLRCVRGGASGEAPSEPALAPPGQYTEVAAGEVRDNYTGLVWQVGYSEAQLSFADASGYCEGLELNGNPFRLPSIRELSTLVDEARVAPSINPDVFPDTQYGSRSNDWYWASHASANDASAAWAINFDDGFTGFNAGSAPDDWNYFTAAWVKCVR